MTGQDKATLLVEMLRPDTVSISQVRPYIEMAGDIILRRRYPMQKPPKEVPEEYDRLQVQMALELWTRKGAEGEYTHSENGIQRVWADGVVSPSLLKLITPLVGVVNENA